MYTQVELLDTNICPTSGKIKYSKRRACEIISAIKSHKVKIVDNGKLNINKRATKSRLKITKNKFPTRCYYCPDCNAYHLTSKSEGDYE